MQYYRKFIIFALYACLVVWGRRGNVVKRDILLNLLDRMCMRMIERCKSSSSAVAHDIKVLDVSGS